MLGSSNPAVRRRLKSPSATLTADGNRANRDSQNDRIRHDLPKDIDLAKISRQPLSAVIRVRKERPRKILSWKFHPPCFRETPAAERSLS